MADNSRASLGTQDGDTFAFDDIGGIKYARSKLVIGADGTSDGDVSAANPLPVSAAALPLPSNAAQETGGNLATVAALSGTQAADATTQTGILALAIASDTPPAVQDGQLAGLSVNAEGRLRVTLGPGVIDWFGDAPMVSEFNNYTSSGVSYV